MAGIDMGPEQLRQYKPALTREPDFDQFWADALEESNREPLAAELTPLPYSVPGPRIYRLSLAGLGRVRLAGYYLVPPGTGPFPALVFYHGYGMDKGAIADYLMWLCQGYVVAVLDVRGQGESQDSGTSPVGGGNVAGYMAKGIESPASYYYRGVYVDTVRLVRFVQQRPEVDPVRIGVTGGSQGGGLALVAAALSGAAAVAVSEEPFLCHFQRAIDIALQGPYLELQEYLRRHPERTEATLRTLSYFDVMNLAERVQCPVRMCVGQMDDVCPPSTAAAAFNHLGGAGENVLDIYPFNRHDVWGYPASKEANIVFLQRHLHPQGAWAR
ncbi:MAG: acetylxylan esterase [Firmicutes bacterium]|nr:acetylxylan esterase [Bacillota bacterium]